MKVGLYFTHAGLTENEIAGKTVVVIDVLRACTVVCQAFASGCREVIPVRTVGDASTLAANLDREVVLLAGERYGHKIEGFDLGNSPFEFTKDIVRDKIIILASTNGSKAMVLGSSGASCYAASFVNVTAVVDQIKANGIDTAIICSGKESKFSLEDAICGGMILSILGSQADLINDAAEVALTMYETHKSNLIAALRNCDHGRYLASIGFGYDIDFAAGIDTLRILPAWEHGRLVPKTGYGNKQSAGAV
jgi:2-phosphosulfolactate phosphatase